MHEVMKEELFQTAKDMMARAYVPYSHFHVGAALLAKSGKIYGGCNVENAAYSPTNCAERTAFFTAIAAGETEFSAICVVGGLHGEMTDYCPPCGVCRQVMREFCDPETFEIYLPKAADDVKVFLLKELLPESFGGENIKE